MKKSFEINLGGRIFNIDEDAYELLNTYIESLKTGFSQNDDGDEIVADIEARLGELCETRMREGSARIVDFAMVDEFITRMGHPESMAEELSEEKNASDGDANSEDNNASNNAFREPWRDAMLLGKKLYRDMRGGLLGGVFSGIAAYTDWNVWLLRAMGIVALYFIGFLTLVVYIILWMILPSATSVIDLIRMREVKPVVGERVEDAWRRAYERASAEVMSGVGNDNKGCLGGCLVVMLALIFLPIIMLISLLRFVQPIVTQMLGMPDVVVGDIGILHDASMSMFNNIMLYILLPVIVIIPIFFVVHYVLQKKNKTKALKQWVIVTLLVVWALFALLFAYLYNGIGNENYQDGVLNSKVFSPKSTVSTTSTSRETLNSFLMSINEASPELEEALMKYYKTDGNAVDSRVYNRVLWHHLASQRSDSLIPFVVECTQFDDRSVLTIMPRDEWREYISTPTSVSRIEVVGHGTAPSELYCVVDTVKKQLWVDLSRCNKTHSVYFEKNSNPGWTTDIVKDGFSLAEHPGCFALSLELYCDGASPVLKLHENVNGETLSKDVTKTVFRKEIDYSRKRPF